MPFVQILECSNTLGTCCSNSGLVILLDAFRKIINLVQIVVPILLILWSMLGFMKMMRNPKEKNGVKNVINKYIAAAVVFFIPVFMDAVLGLMPNTFSVSACWNQAKISSETARSSNHQYIDPSSSKKTKTLVDPGDYEHGVQKPKDSTDDSSGVNIAAGDAKGILAGAERVHTVYEQQKWSYYTSLNQLRWNDITYSTNNPSKKTCCATFVGSAFLAGGVFTEQEINQYNYNSQYGISELCQAHGWIKITSYSQLQAGDVVIMSGPEGGSAPGHVQIYAGGGTWYNAGSTDAIQRANPYSIDSSARFLYAWRIPAGGRS